MTAIRNPRIRILPETKVELDLLLDEIGEQILGRPHRIKAQAAIIDKLVKLAREKNLLLNEANMKRNTQAENARLYVLGKLITACRERIKYESEKQNPDSQKLDFEKTNLAELISERNELNGKTVNK